MSTLDFLSLDVVEAIEGFTPVARSPMARRLRDAGAEFEERDGWLVATRVAGEERHALGVRDLTHACRVREGKAGVLVALTAGTPREPYWTGELWYGEERPPEGERELDDLSAGYAALEIEGPGATTVLRRLTELDLGTLPAVGAVAHTRAFVFLRGDEHFLVVFPQEYGHYLWEVVVDAAEPLGGAPKGTP